MEEITPFYALGASLALGLLVGVERGWKEREQAEGRRVAAGIPGAEFVEVDSSNTFLIASDPAFDRVMDATLDFLAQDGPA